jgi:hypothetical protein
MYRSLETKIDTALNFELWRPKVKTEEYEVQKILKNRFKALKEVFHDNLLIGMLRNAKKDITDMGIIEIQGVYRLSAIDLFVEKAIYILEKEADRYKTIGTWLLRIAALPIIFGIVVAFLQLYPELLYQYFPKSQEWADSRYEIEHNKTLAYIDLYKYENNVTQITAKDGNVSNTNQVFIQSLIDREVALSWKEVLANFVKSFTFYGLLVLSAVRLKRFGKAMFDQSERLSNRRHALREGRLYLHIKNGYVDTVEEFDKVFNWNASHSNAFADIPTDAQAPWGTALKEALNIIPKTVEASKGK